MNTCYLRRYERRSEIYLKSYIFYFFKYNSLLVNNFSHVPTIIKAFVISWHDFLYSLLIHFLIMC